MKQTADAAIDPKRLLEIGLRRRWLLLIPLCLALMVGIYLVVTLPRIYTASTLILIQPQKVPEEYVRSIVSADSGQRINSISQQITSRSNLERIIKEFNLFSAPENAAMFEEDKIALLRKWISVDLRRSDRRGPAEALSISFKGKDPRLVMRVTNALASYFIDENLKVREAQALGTSDFLDDELQEIRTKLEQQEESLKNYRARYMGGLPEQLQTNLRILEGLQLQLNMKNESLRYAKNNLLLLDKQIDAARSAAAGAAADGSISSPPADAHSADEIRLEALKAQLSELRLSYTEKHPDIVRLLKTIAELEQKIAASPQPIQAPLQPDGRDEHSAWIRERNELKIQIATLQDEIKNVENQIRYYQKMVENTPKREQELLLLKRDYQNVKEIYDSMLARKLESDIAVSMEKKQKGEQFRVIDPANVPQKPSDPDMKKLFIMVMAAGLGIGGGLVFLLEYLNSAFRRPEEVESMLELPVLATIPRLYRLRDKRLSRLNAVMTFLCLVFSAVLLAAFTLLTFKGVEPTLDGVRRLVGI